MNYDKWLSYENCGNRLEFQRKQRLENKSELPFNAKKIFSHIYSNSLDYIFLFIYNIKKR